MNKTTVTNMINEAFGAAPAYWVPSVLSLGWSLKVSEDGSLVTINRQLGDAYKTRVAVGLRALFAKNNLPVEVITDNE